MNKICKKLLSTVLVTALLLYGLCLPAYAAENMDLNCKSAILVDANTGAVIFEKNSHEKLPPASVTKIMTMLLIMEAVDSGKATLDDKVTISPTSSSKNAKGTMLLLEAGEVRTLKELLYGIAVESANDACLAVGEYLAGSQEEFVRLMNKRAKELGMNDTNFINPNGLHIDGHVTSANDISVMSRELLKHPKIHEFISKYMVTVYVGRNNDVKRELVNKNKLIRFCKDVDGIKTGFTDEAGFCISLSAKRNNLRLISVIMGAPNKDVRNRDARKLLDYGFANYSNYPVVNSGAAVKELKVTKGDVNKLNAVTKDNVSVLILKGEDKNIKKIVNAPDTVSAPIKKGQKLGEIVILNKDKEIGKYPLVSDREVVSSGFFSNLRKSLEFWLGNDGR